MNLMYGSRGDEVKKLQQALNDTGKYTLDVDGKYGPATQSAVRDYQTQNRLKIDGIAGTETLGHLYAAKQQPAQSQTQNQTQTQTQPSSQLTYNPAADPVYQQALSALQQAQKNLPSYKGSFDGELQQLYGRIENRQPFSYDPGSDPLYRQMAEQYARQGRMAMMDTVGQAAALTGGYSSTYGQTAGQQQYGAYLQKLGEAVPELYAAAYDRYEKEGQALQQRYAMVSGLAGEEYSRYQDALSQYWKNVSHLQEQADDAYQRGVSAEKTAYDRRQDAYKRLSGLLAEGYSPTAAELAAAGMTEAEAKLYRGEAAAASGTYRQAAAEDPGYNNLGYTVSQVIHAQRYVGAPLTGKWDARSAAVAKQKGFGHLGAVIAAMELPEAEDGIATDKKRR